MRAKFFLNQAGAISSDNREEHFLTPNGKNAKIFCYKYKLSESSEVYVYSDGYSSEAEARIDGGKVKKPILIACSMRRISVDVSKDRATVFLGKEFKEESWNKHQVQIIPEVHGLDVFDANKRTHITRASGGDIILVNSATDLINDIQSLVSTAAYLNETDLLPFELYGASGFEKSSRARFFTLMLALESVIEQKARSPIITKAVEDLIKSIDAMDLNPDKMAYPDEMISVKSSISMLNKESISKSGQNLSETLLGSKKYQELEPSDFFKRCYKIRGKLSHKGETNIPEHEFSGLAATLEIFVHDILEAKISQLADDGINTNE